jgi:hypothetical protein
VARHVSRRIRTILVLGMVALLAAATTIAAPLAGAASEDLQMDARGLLQGHARAGAWTAIEVHLQNAGPSIVGELRLAGGAQGRTRFSLPVDLPTESNKTFVLYAQPPAFGGTLDVALLAGGATIATRKVELNVHPATQLVVGVVAEQPQRIVPNLGLAPNNNSEAPATVVLAPEDLPSRVEAWSPLDRLIWQDVDSNRLTAEQLTAMRSWLAGGGRLVIAGGSAGPGVLSAFPDDILPYRPTATLDAPPESLTSLLGTAPHAAADIPALGGELVRGRLLASVGDRAIAAEAPLGSGVVSLVGIDPGTQVAKPRPTTRIRAARPRRRQLDHHRCLAAAGARAAPDRGPAPPPRRLHPAHRAHQLRRAPKARPPRVGVDHDARADRRVRGRLVRLRCRASRPGRDCQRGRDRARRPRHDGWAGTGLPGRVLALARDVPAEASPRRPALVHPERRAERQPGHAGPRPGDPVGDPQPRDRVRIAANPARRDTGSRAADPGRTAARGGHPQGRRPEPVGRDPREAGHRPGWVRDRAPRPRTRDGAGDRAAGPLEPGRPEPGGQDRGPGVLRRPEPGKRQHAAQPRASRRDRPARVRRDDR